MAIYRGEVGPRLKAMRLAQGLSLRAFCASSGLDPANYSRVERGLFAPPTDDRLDAILDALGADRASREYQELADLAAIDRGKLPEDVLQDEQMMRALPLFFRAVRERDDASLDRFIEAVRGRPADSTKDNDTYDPDPPAPEDSESPPSR